MAKRLMLSHEARQVLVNWYEPSLISDTPVKTGTFYGLLFGLFRQHAVTLNGEVHVARGAPDIDSSDGIKLVGHEFFHVEEQRRTGWWRYLLAYVCGWRPTQIRDGRSHPMESGAYARGREVLDMVKARRSEVGGDA